MTEYSDNEQIYDSGAGSNFVCETDDINVAIDYLLTDGIVRYNKHTLTDDSIDGYPIKYLDDIEQIRLGRMDKQAIITIYESIGKRRDDDADAEGASLPSSTSEAWLDKVPKSSFDSDVNEEEDADDQQQPTKTVKRKIDKRKLFKDYPQTYDSLLRYPFKSKTKYFDKSIHNIQEPIVRDYKLKIAKKLCKPNFSKTPGCWEIDVMFAKHYTGNNNDYIRKQTIYLTFLNVNTRYLHVIPVPNREIDTYIDAIKTWQHKHLIDKGKFETITGPRGGKSKKRIPDNERYVNTSNIKTLKGDGEFDSVKFKQFCRNYGINLIIDDSPYTLHNKSIDSVMRTLRNAFGLNDNRIADNNLMQQMVNYYNDTPHRSLRFPNYDTDSRKKWIYHTPAEMYRNQDLEWQYIRMMTNKLQSINRQQEYKGLLNYKTGNIILIHLDKGKTKKLFEKQRRVFNDIAEFKCYRNGNVVCRILKPYSELIKYVNDNTYHKHEFVREPSKDKYAIPKDYITVPIAYTKYVCKDYDSIPTDYRTYFNLV